jgi:hypothetical protein
LAILPQLKRGVTALPIAGHPRLEEERCKGRDGIGLAALGLAFADATHDAPAEEARAVIPPAAQPADDG